VVGHAGTRLLADLADATGLSMALGEALAPLRQRNRGHDPGRVALDMALMLADGGEAIADLAALRNQHELFGPVASNATAWRVLDGIDDAALARIRTAGARARELAIEGLRHQVFITDSPRSTCSVQLLELRHRSHARVEDRIRTSKDSGFGRFPSRLFAINQAWLELALIGIDLLAWTRTLLLDGEHARPSQRSCVTGSCTSPPASSAPPAAPSCE
jgi:hypothetical protein